MTMSIRSLAEVKRHLSELTNRFQADHDRAIVTAHGKSWQESH
jgi:PHD/YefM family antitoxin component YafN of YafNO toxin-antitoxin module